MKKGRKISFLLVLSLAVVTDDAWLATAVGAGSTNSAAPGSWLSDPKLAGALAPEVKIGPFGIHPPAGYTLHQTPSASQDGTGTTYNWVGPRNADGTNPVFSVDILILGSRKTSRMTSGDYVRQELSFMQQSHAGAVLSPIAAGRINGLPFTCAFWKGIGPRTGKTFHGVIYGRVAKPLMIRISGKDEEPAGGQTLLVFEAAALTLRKR